MSALEQARKDFGATRLNTEAPAKTGASVLSCLKGNSAARRQSRAGQLPDPAQYLSKNDAGTKSSDRSSESECGGKRVPTTWF